MNTDQTISTPILLTDSSEIAEVGARIAASGRFAMDLEFMSADRYIPDLALVQLAWEEEGALEMVLIDGVDTELGPIYAQVESETVLTVAHGAKQDLSLLAMRYQVKAGAFVDTQIAAAFAGIAEQIGYGNLVDKLLGKRLDKGPQFTNWLRRPLSEKQLRYALDDVRYLFPVWDAMKLTLDKENRRGWALEESAIMAESAAHRRPALEAYKKIGSSGSLKGSALGALRALAAWRDTVAVEGNIPPSWILPDTAAIEVCRKNVRSEKDLKRVRGVGQSTVEKYGTSIVAAIAEGRHKPVASDSIPRPLSPPFQAQAAIIVAIVAGKAAQIGMSARAICAKADAEALVRHHLGHKEAGECRLLQGWRAELIGSEALSWLQGNGAVVADAKVGVVLAP